MTRNQAYFCAAAGAALWGTLGLFVQTLYDAGFTPWQTVAIRVIVSVLMIVGFLGITKPSYLKIDIKDIPFFIGTGIISIVFFNWCYFTVIDEASLSLAVVLLYTGPLFVTIISRFLFKEYFTRRKILALVVTVTGCAFTVGLLPSLQVNVSPAVLLIGIGSGFFYALYSIFGKYVSQKYHSLTITAYSFICASFLMVPAGGLAGEINKLLQLHVFIPAVCLAFFSTLLGYILYTSGLAYIESSRAAILTTIEPVVAILIGVTVFGDLLNAWQGIGVLLVLCSVLLVTENKKRESIISKEGVTSNYTAK